MFGIFKYQKKGTLKTQNYSKIWIDIGHFLLQYQIEKKKKCVGPVKNINTFHNLKIAKIKKKTNLSGISRYCRQLHTPANVRLF